MPESPYKIIVNFEMIEKTTYLPKNEQYKLKIINSYKSGCRYGHNLFFFNIISCLKKLHPSQKIKYKELVKNKKFNILNEIFASQVVVSLTSYPARINSVAETIRSLFAQNLKPEVVVLWLASDEFPNLEKDLPLELLALKEQGLNIAWTEDLKSYKKIIPLLKTEKYTGKIIVTVDDDIKYNEDWMLELFVEHLAHPEAIIAHRGHRIKFDSDEKIASYSNWWQDSKNTYCDYRNFFTGCGGVLYPTASLHKLTTHAELFQQLCPSGDDIWLWAMAVLNKTPIKLVENSSFKIEHISGSQEHALWKSNVHQGYNDKMLAGIFEEYSLVKERVFALRSNFEKAVSIIIPVFNTGEYLRQCLNSILNQSFEDLEVICVDDGSTDNLTKKILLEYKNQDSRVNILAQRNAGPATARNNGMKNSQGEYIIFVDSDDYISPEYVEMLYKEALFSNADVAVADKVVAFGDQNRHEFIKRTGFENAHKFGKKEVIANAIMASGASWNKIYKKDFLLKNNLAFLDGVRCPAEDNYFSTLTLLANNINIAYAKNATYFYRQHTASITKSLSQQSLIDSIKVYIKIRETLIGKNIPDLNYWINTINQRAKKDIFWNMREVECDAGFKSYVEKEFPSTIDICCIADEAYLIPTAVFLASLLKSKTSDVSIKAFILVPAGSTKKMRVLESLSASGLQVKLIEVEQEKFNHLHRYKVENNFCMASPAAMFKFIIPEIFSELDRILYIDTDLIVRKDILNLYMIDIEDFYLAAVPDMWKMITDREEVTSFEKYFNSGVMLMNLRKMRQDNLPEKLIKAKIESKSFDLMDQDVFNEVCVGHVKHLDVKYNFLPVFFKRHKEKIDIAILNRLYNTNYNAIEALAQDPVVAHWAGSDKPWKDKNVLFAKEWQALYEGLSIIDQDFKVLH